MAVRALIGILAGTQQGTEGVGTENLGTEGVEFTICYEGSEIRAKVLTPGIHNVYNALAAIGIGIHFGVAMKDAIDAVSEVELTDMRLTVRRRRSVIKSVSRTAFSLLHTFYENIMIIPEFLCFFR